MKILESINVSKNYTKNKKNDIVLKNINLTVKKGEFVIIYGSSGSGKTTFLNIMSGLSKPSSGKIIIGNVDYSGLESRAKTKFRGKYISYIFQNYGLIPLINVLDNVLIGIQASGILKNKKAKYSMTEYKKKAMLLLTNLKIGHLADRFPSELSGGQQQRVAIARALLKKPLVIFADEPTGALDNTSSRSVIEIFKKLSMKGQTIIMVTHDENLKSFADKVVYIKNGEISHIHQENNVRVTNE